MAADETVPLSGVVDRVMTKRVSTVQFNVPFGKNEKEDGREDPPTNHPQYNTQDAFGNLNEDMESQLHERTNSVSEEHMRYLDNPQNVEKRFPVDRRKLEKLIQDGRNNETAEEYFKHIQEETKTLILWPSRLKIGAKSKKDPQVKVLGLPGSVQKAREIILTDLDTKSIRVTLKIEIPFSEHSHVIGKEGVNIKKVHNDTKCHIHFPDHNRLYSGMEKSNQVSITGEAASVETARRKIRELIPIVVTFTLPMSQYLDVNSLEVQQMMLAYNVNIHVKPQSKGGSVLVVIKGTVKHMAGLKLAFSKVVELITGDSHIAPIVSHNLDISPQHHRTLIGNAGGNIRGIMDHTNTTIQFPDPNARHHSNQVVVNGTIDAVFQAREDMLGCLPAVLMFDVHESDTDVLSSTLIGELSQVHDVFISVKPKKGQVQSVIIKSIEQNIQWMYDARVKMLECSYQPGQLLTTPTNEVPKGMSPNPPNSSNDFEMTGVKSNGVPLMLTVKGVSGGKDVVQPSNSPELFGEEKSNSMERQELSPSPTEPQRRTSPLGASLNSATPPRKMTTKRFLEYEKMREEATIAMKTKVEASEPRHPTRYWAGNYFSESMPAGPPGLPDHGHSPTSPKGLQSLSKRGYAELVKQASQERVLALQTEHDQFIGVTDIPALLKQLGLNHYEERFQEEEVDFETLLTMSEADLKEIGVNTLGARRKLQIAISELKKVQGKAQHPTQPSLVMSARGSKSLGRGMTLRNPPTGNFVNRSGSLKWPNAYSMSHSGRF